MSINAADFDYVRDLVHKRAAIVIEPDRQYLVESRLMTLAYREGFSTIHDLVSRVRAHPELDLDKKLIEAMTTNETMFFRDISPFEALRKLVLPEILVRRAVDRRLNLWCGASSSGQEPYSVAILLREHFPHVLNWRLHFLATDLSAEMVTRAQEGRYSQLEVNRGLPAALLVKYFEKQGTGWRIKEELRRMIEFRELNLCKAWPPLPEMDIVFLRNVLIYFDADTKKAILAKLRRTLRPDGYLFVGSAETTINLDDAFQPVLYDKTVFYRLHGR